MKIFKKAVAGIATASFLIAQPLAAAPVQRNTAGSDTSEKLAGHSLNALVVIGVFGLLLLLAEVTNLIDVFGNDDELPQSP
jgi:hypothetical protein